MLLCQFLTSGLSLGVFLSTTLRLDYRYSFVYFIFMVVFIYWTLWVMHLKVYLSLKSVKFCSSRQATLLEDHLDPMEDLLSGFVVLGLFCP